MEIVESEASYLYLSDRRVNRTVMINDRILVDVDKDNKIVGIERIGGEVDLAATLDILRAITV